jgi:O-antigen ligase
MTSRDLEEGFTVQMVQTARGSSLVEPHNTFLMLAVEYGLLFGFVLFVVSLVGLFRLVRRSGLPSADVVLPLGIVVFLLQTLGSSHLLIAPRVATFFWIWLGLTIATAGKPQTPIEGQRSQAVPRSVVGWT